MCKNKRQIRQCLELVSVVCGLLATIMYFCEHKEASKAVSCEDCASGELDE